ncbi:hypothetical protein, partial [Microcoleus asticus]|uniref:hypothetical protein n=1 Tax=Microcoleus asticus TaxID=2815231 RepID=UPI001C1311EA
MIQDVAHVSVSKKLYDLLVPQNVTILEMSIISFVSSLIFSNFVDIRKQGICPTFWDFTAILKPTRYNCFNDISLVFFRKVMFNSV